MTRAWAQGALYDLVGQEIVLTATADTVTFVDLTDQGGGAAAKPFDVFIPDVGTGDVIEYEAEIAIVAASSPDVGKTFRVVPVVAGVAQTDRQTPLTANPSAYCPTANGLHFVRMFGQFRITDGDSELGGVRLRIQHAGNHSQGTFTVQHANGFYAEAPPVFRARKVDRYEGTLLVVSSQSLLIEPAVGPAPYLVAATLNAEGYLVGLQAYGKSGEEIDERGAEPGMVQYATDAWKRSIALVSGGYTDLLDEAATAATAYDRISDRAERLKTTGYVDYVFGMTIPDATSWEGNATANTRRTDYNTLLVADADGFFDGVVDLRNVDGFETGGTGDYYADGVHFSAAGAEVVAERFLELVRPLVV